MGAAGRNGPVVYNEANFYYRSPIRIHTGYTKSHGRIILWPTRLLHGNGPARSVRYHTFTDYRRKVTASAGVLRPINKSSGGVLFLYRLTLCSIHRFPSLLDIDQLDITLLQITDAK
ncbi:hypothetical protein EVAR_33124_1 [Eumeta japonica]|uniref:Uncharacterized protein n=1 Tax=Eumeta variegata TaxID=151549 RepID=A0A4C1Y660_EUMVA|nr:hypothetical protein EVAR_33124_1 [Eumeta japonica]